MKTAADVLPNLLFSFSNTGLQYNSKNVSSLPLKHFLLFRIKENQQSSPQYISCFNNKISKAYVVVERNKRNRKKVKALKLFVKPDKYVRLVYI